MLWRHVTIEHIHPGNGRSAVRAWIPHLTHDAHMGLGTVGRVTEIAFNRVRAIASWVRSSYCFGSARDFMHSVRSESSFSVLRSFASQDIQVRSATFPLRNCFWNRRRMETKLSTLACPSFRVG